MKFNIVDTYYCEIELNNETVLAKRGSMVSYKGDIEFESKSLGDGLKDKLFNALKRSLTGEGISLMKCSGNGSVYLADRARSLIEINLEHGDSLSIESDYLLSFSPHFELSVEPSGFGGAASGKGFFTSKISAPNGKGDAILSIKGKPLILETPCYVDPDALVAWTGPNGKLVKSSVDWKTVVGRGAGETYTCYFNQPGYLVIIQPDEGPLTQTSPGN